ncbi:MAG: phage Gp37/Gp68 family protein [Actinomycetota bacterium]
MGERTAIGWTDHTFNPWWGCERVSPACQFCYAEAFAKRTGHPVWGKSAPRRFFSDRHWNEPRKWHAKAERDGVRRRVFCASMADVFEDRDDLVEHRERLFDLIAETPHLDWLLLTKRPNVAFRVFNEIGWQTGESPDVAWHGPSNVWIGTTVEDQQRAEERIPWLTEIASPVRFLSCEPLLGPVDLTSINVLRQEPDDWPQLRVDGLAGAATNGDVLPLSIDWVICGGESGPKHRPLDLAHARSLRDQCTENENPIDGSSDPVPFFFKQVGGRTPAAGGDLLDGVEWKQFPGVAV